MFPSFIGYNLTYLVYTITTYLISLVATIFSTKLERIIHLNFLAQASNQVLLEHGDSMLEMWRQIDLHNISDRAGWIIGNKDTVIGEQCNQCKSRVVVMFYINL